MRHFAGVDVHAQGTLFTVAAMDGMTLHTLQPCRKLAHVHPYMRAVIAAVDPRRAVS